MKHTGKSALQHLQGFFLVAQSGEDAGEVVAHVEVVGIDEQRPVDPLARLRFFAEECVAAGEDAERGAVAGVLLDGALGFRDHHLCGFAELRLFTCRRVAARQHRPGVEVRLHQLGGFFVVPSRCSDVACR